MAAFCSALLAVCSALLAVYSTLLAVNSTLLAVITAISIARSAVAPTVIACVLEDWQDTCPCTGLYSRVPGTLYYRIQTLGGH
jgi:hypothetical protein